MASTPRCSNSKYSRMTFTKGGDSPTPGGDANGETGKGGLRPFRMRLAERQDSAPKQTGETGDADAPGSPPAQPQTVHHENANRPSLQFR